MRFDLKARDFAVIGIGCLAAVIVAFLGGAFGLAGPEFIVPGKVFAVLLGGFVAAAVWSRCPKMGAMTIIGFVTGLIMTATVYTGWAVLFATIFGFIGDMIASRRGFATRLSLGRGLGATAVFSLWYVSSLMPVFLMAEPYVKSFGEKFGDDYSIGLLAMLTPGNIIVWIILMPVLGALGGWLGMITFNRASAAAPVLARRQESLA